MSVPCALPMVPPVLSGTEENRSEHIPLPNVFTSHAPLLLFHRTREPLIPTVWFKFLPASPTSGKDPALLSHELHLGPAWKQNPGGLLGKWMSMVL